MKKYSFGILALVLAIGFSAFTKPSTSVFFEFTGDEFDARNDAIVKDVAPATTLWVNNSTCGSNTQQMPCTIEITDASYYHTVSGVGIFLNDQAYVDTHPGANVAALSTTGFTTSNPTVTTYYVTTSSGVVATVFNKARP